MERPKLTPQDLEKDELENILNGVIEALWPGGDPDHEWSPDTLNEIKDALSSYGLDPH